MSLGPLLMGSFSLKIMLEEKQSLTAPFTKSEVKKAV